MSNQCDKAYGKFLDLMEGKDLEPDYPKDAFFSAWKSCKKLVLEILSNEFQNTDLSWESCDKRFIEMIKKL